MILVKFTHLVGMITDQNFYEICFTVFYPNAFATAEGENCAYGPTLLFRVLRISNTTTYTTYYFWLMIKNS